VAHEQTRNHKMGGTAPASLEAIAIEPEEFLGTGARTAYTARLLPRTGSAIQAL
jgi:hypothetical protein